MLKREQLYSLSIPIASGRCRLAVGGKNFFAPTAFWRTVATGEPGAVGDSPMIGWRHQVAAALDRNRPKTKVLSLWRQRRMT